MKIIERIDALENVTLISLENAPSGIAFLSELFALISKNGVNVDMIARTPARVSGADLCFTVGDGDLSKALEISNELRRQNGGIKAGVNSGNVKISVFGEAMRASHGVAAKVFKTVADAGAEILLLTTSEVDISILLTQHDAQKALQSLEFLDL